jgi:hypothetical protein
MIAKEEVLRIAGLLGLGPQVVEKDYALGWCRVGVTGKFSDYQVAGVRSRPSLSEKVTETFFGDWAARYPTGDFAN